MAYIALFIIMFYSLISIYTMARARLVSLIDAILLTLGTVCLWGFIFKEFGVI